MTTHRTTKCLLALAFCLVSVSVAVVYRTRGAGQSGQPASAPGVPPSTDDPPGPDDDTWDIGDRAAVRDSPSFATDAAVAPAPPDVLPDARSIGSPEASTTNRPPGRDRSRRAWQDWLEDLKKTDPRQYEDIMARRQAADEQLRAARAGQIAYFAGVDTSTMTEPEREDYAQIVRLLTETWQLSQLLRADLTPDQREPIRNALREDMAALQPLLESERNREWYSIGLQLGYDDGDAHVFTDFLNRVLDMTSLRRPGAGAGGGGPPGAGLFRDGGAPTAAMQEYGQTLQASLAERAQFLGGLDTDTMTPEDRQNYAAALQLLNETQQLAGRLAASPSPGEAQLLQRALRQDMFTLQPMLEIQRANIWNSLALQVGYSPAEASAFVDTLNGTVSATSMRTLYRNLRGGMPPPPSGASPPSPTIPAR